MFKIIGGDGREYGPVTADQLREWILDHRADARTMVRGETMGDWAPLGSLPEFAAALEESARLHGYVLPTPGPETAAAPVALDHSSAGVGHAVRGEFEVLDCLGRAWQLLQRHFLLITSATALAWVIRTMPQLVPGATGCLGFVVSLAMSGAVFGGLSVMLAKLIRGEPATVGDVFGCFDARFMPCLSVYVITGLLEDLGMALCILPGVFLTTVWAFSLPLAAVRGASFTQAVEGSWGMVLPRFFRVLALLGLALLPVVVFSAYSTVLMVGHVREVLGPPDAWNPWNLVTLSEKLMQGGARLGLERELVLLLNLPFAWTALMVAYEDLFGTKRPLGT